jgi:hypothetical protein
MNYIKHLASFFERVVTDDRLNPTHISMYVSLFQFWNANRFQNPISISRNELMKVSKISAKATYHKCMKELNEWQYLKYKPSYNPFKGSLVYLFNVQTGDEQALIAHHTKIETSIEQAQEPYINIYKHYKQNSINIDKQTKKIEVQNLNGLGKKEKSSAKKERDVISNDSEKSHQFKEPNLEQVQEYFDSKKFPPLEAEKFYNYFQSNGWLIGGRTKMKNWKAAANNWMLNAQKFNSPTSQRVRRAIKPKHLQTNQSKNYNEPL